MRLLLVFVSLFAVTACVAPGIKSVDDASRLSSNDIMIVGKIRLVPKYEPTEQTLPGLMFNSDMVENKVFVAFDQQLKPVKDYATFSGIDNVASVSFDQTFMVAAKRTQPLIFSGAFFMSGISGAGGDYYLLPGGLQLNYDQSDRAIYFGTLVFHRNDYDEITKVELLDEYVSANREFRNKHGDALRLKRVKAVRIKN